MAARKRFCHRLLFVVSCLNSLSLNDFPNKRERLAPKV